LTVGPNSFFSDQFHIAVNQFCEGKVYVQQISLVIRVDLSSQIFCAIVQIIVIPKAKGGDPARIIYNYFRAVRNVRARRNLRFIAYG